MTKSKFTALMALAYFLVFNVAEAHEYVPTRATMLKKQALQVKKFGGGDILF